MIITVIISATVSMNLVATNVFVTMATVEMEQIAVSYIGSVEPWQHYLCLKTCVFLKSQNINVSQFVMHSMQHVMMETFAWRVAVH